MKKYLDVLKNTDLFAGLGEDGISAMLDCLGAEFETYEKDEYVFHAGEYVRKLAILAEGGLHIQKDDYWGNRTIVNRISAGEMFGEAYLAPDSGALINDVIAVEKSVVLFVSINRILSVCSSACKFHSLAVKNLFFAVCEKNKSLVTKLGYLSNRTTREKLLSYISDEAKKQKSSSITIPFNRQQLADFLSVDRSAMSNELCKMRDEGLIEFNKNRFRLL